MKLLFIKPSTNQDKKLMAKFELESRDTLSQSVTKGNGVTPHSGTSRTKTVHFGAKGMMDYTKYYKQDKTLANDRKKAYISRHRTNENWNDPTSAGTLSKYILWNLPTIEASIKSYKNTFWG
tara:strand:- start:1043 stop:1408 length:366 start_codon:yes stop_codon:yes gene_type:complete